MNDLLTLFPVSEVSKARQQMRNMAGARKNKKEHDFYPTPEIATVQFLERERFDGEIWECACGDGSMSRVLERYGYSVKSTDLIYRGYGEGNIDFLRCKNISENIVTNPPFDLANKFIHHALKHSLRKVALLLRLNYVASKVRKPFFIKHPFSRLYVFSERVSFEANTGANSMIDFAWFVWDHAHVGEPVIRWL